MGASELAAERAARRLASGLANGLAAHLEAVAGSGGVDSVALLHQSDGRPRGMAKVRMKSAALASACIAQLDGARFGGRELKVRLDGAPSAHHLARS